MCSKVKDIAVCYKERKCSNYCRYGYSTDLTGFKFNGKEFISITSTGTGLNKSETFQNIKINTILVMDNQKLTTSSFLNYVSDTLALGFFDNDTILEYLEFINNPVLENSGNINIL